MRETLTKNNCSFLLRYLYDLASICFSLKEQNEALTHLEEARKIVTDTDCNDWALVHLLVEIIIKYPKMGSIPNCMKVLRYVKHREIVKSSLKQSRSLTFNFENAERNTNEKNRVILKFCIRFKFCFKLEI